MNRKSWQDREGHPPAALLLLHVERELEEREADTVRSHVSACAKCRATCEHLDRGISRFIKFRDKVVLPTPAPRVRDLEARFLEAETRSSKVRFIGSIKELFRGTSARRLAFVLGGAACALIIFVFVFLSIPKQSVYASQILNEARNASESLIVHSKVLNQRIRLQRGNVVIERIAHHGRQVPAQTKDPRVDDQLQQALYLAHINLTDPLNVNDFTDWRAAQNDHADSVRETAQSLIITIHVSGSATTEGSLTLSRSELRPIARSVEFTNEAPIEINEESYSISDSTPSHSESAKVTPPSGTAAPINAVGTPEPTALDLESSELDLREAFHAIGADISAAPQILRADHTVLFHASPRNAGQREAIRQAANRIPHVKETDKELLETTETLQPIQMKGANTTEPPLARALERSLGSELAATKFIESLRGRSSKVQAEADALDQLGKRYSVETVKALPPDLRKRVNSLASGMLSSLQHDAANYVESLSPALDDVAQGLSVPSSAEDGDNLPGCLAWQQSASLAAPKLRNLHEDISLMFLPQTADKSSAPTGEQLISESRRIRSFLELHLMSTCQLF